MANFTSISITRAILHILDRNTDEPILAGAEPELSGDSYAFLESHIIRALQDEELRVATFDAGRQVVREAVATILADGDAFVEGSQDLARQLFTAMQANPAISSADLAVVACLADDLPLIAILKLDYTKSFIHDLEMVNEHFRVNIIPQLTGLPGMNQKVQKAAFVLGRQSAGAEHDLFIVDKQSHRSPETGVAEFFVGGFLHARLIDDEREKTKRFHRATEDWTRTTLKNDAVKQEQVRSAMTEALTTQEVVDVEQFAQSAFQGEPALVESYQRKLESVGLPSKEIAVDPEYVAKATRKKRIRTDTGIELVMDSEAYHDPDRVVIQRNMDGTVNFCIVGVRSYTERR